IITVSGFVCFFFSSRRRHTSSKRDWSSDVCSSDMVASAGWWIALVELTSVDSRPYVGGSQTNSFLELTFGYNGFGRLAGNETGSVGGGGQGGGWGETGITWLFTGSFGQHVSWFLPTALYLLLTTVVLLVLVEAARRRGRTEAPAGTASGGR